MIANLNEIEATMNLMETLIKLKLLNTNEECEMIETLAATAASLGLLGEP